LIQPDFQDSDDDDLDFFDALDTITEKMFTPATRSPNNDAEPLEETKDSLLNDVDDEPAERDMLPWLKDPNVKISIWAILKDNIGKDISKISVPVFFNDPTSLL
jgi:hypothetical protein